MVPSSGDSCKFYWGSDLKTGKCIKDCGSYVLITGDDGFIYPIENRESFVPLDYIAPHYEDKIYKEIKAFFSNWKAVLGVGGMTAVSVLGMMGWPIVLWIGCLLFGFFFIIAVKEIVYTFLCAVFRLPDPYKRDENGKIMRW